MLKISTENTWTLKERLHFLGLFSFFNGFLFIFLGSYFFLELQQSLALLEPSLNEPLTFMGKLAIYAYSFLNFFSYMLVLALIVALLSFSLTFFIRKKALFIFLTLCFFSFTVSFFILDIKVYQLYHFHISWSLITLMSDFSSINPSSEEIAIIVVFLLGIIATEYTLVILTLKQRKAIGFNVCRNTALVASLGQAICYSVLIVSMSKGNNVYAQQTTFYPMYHQLFSALTFNKKHTDNLFYFTNRRFKNTYETSAKLHYPLAPLHCKPNNPARYNVILILVDTLRFDALTPKQMPKLYRRKNKFTQFTNHWSGGNSTKPGVFSLFYGIPATYWQASIDAKTPPLMNTKFKEAGYDLTLSMSSHIKNPSLSKNVYLNYTNIYSALSFDYAKPGTRRDKQATEYAITQLNQTHEKPLFLNLFLDSVHSYCDVGTVTPYFQPIIKRCNRIFGRAHSERVPYYNQYKNTVRFVDKQIEKVLRTLDEKKLWDNSIVIITSDHGEEFDDNRQGYWGHTSNYTQYQLKVPLLIHWPHTPAQQIKYRTTHYDLAPTLLENALGCDKQSKTYSSGINLFDEINRAQFFLASSYTNNAMVTPTYTMLFSAGSTLQTQTPKGKNTAQSTVDKQMLKKAWLEMSRFYH